MAVKTRNKPFIIALEGIDGSGKSVQFARLRDRLSAEGFRTAVMDFPCYGSFFGSEIGRLLSGGGEDSALSVDARSMSLWYAMDRFAEFKKFDPDGIDVLLLNRSTMANAAYQGSRVHLKAEDSGDDPDAATEAYVRWLFRLEFEELAIPEPDMFFIFDIPVGTSRKNVSKKGHREYVGGTRSDVYEKDTRLLAAVRAGYMTCARLFPGSVVLECTRADGNMRPIDDIAEEVWEKVAGRLGRAGQPDTAKADTTDAAVKSGAEDINSLGKEVRQYND